ncbi:chaoptin [Aethina tumida]|uniref:chaoptin n=1 Tax=Aethina tumida TaxID=116153 RepID=UPI0021478A61|nr:chaoptin [Aethina tumida]XP_049819212.1 chaoptin [Aethina tumida]XP_049819213.1 chaoptin [Aethina tumida]
MIILLLIGLLTLTRSTQEAECDKNIDFHNDHGYGYDISCKSLTDANKDVLEDIVINNEFSVMISSSTINNASPKLFHNVLNIKKLTIDNSTFKIPDNQPIFEKLGSLLDLKILRTNFKAFKNVFRGMDNLEELELDENDLEYIPEGTFENIQHLQMLKITNNKLKHMRDIPICETKKLKMLNLEHNMISTLSNFKFSCNKHRDSIGLSLNDDMLNVGIQDNSYLNTSETFTNLIMLNLKHNSITDIGLSLADLKGLKIIDLEGNNLKTIRLAQFDGLDSLEKINLRNNKIKMIDDAVFLKKPYLYNLNLEGNLITKINLNSTTTLRHLNLAHNKLVLTSLSILNNLKGLKELVISNNQISEIIPNEFRNFTSLEILDVSSNNLTLHNESFNDLKSLQNLIISNNNIKRLPSGVFATTLELKTLDISHNQFEVLPTDVFYSLINLESLNMSYNRLENLQFILFKPLKKLNLLDIAGNRLKYIQYDLIINNLPSLSVINVKHNWLSCQFLYKMITFLKDKSISYTINEKFEYEKENVEGIYCKEGHNEENIIANHLVGDENASVSSWAIFLMVLAGVFASTFAIYKAVLIYRRRRYTVDQFELIEG